MIDIKELSKENLEQIIENIKEECEKRAKDLKLYEEELRRRKPEVPFGVPLSNRVRRYYCVSAYGHINESIDEKDCMDNLLFEIMNYFSSKESAEKHAEMLLAWRKALIANAKGEPIDIEVLKPLLPKGWFFMTEDNQWHYTKTKPKIAPNSHGVWLNSGIYHLDMFNLKPADDWKTSLQECGL